MNTDRISGAGLLLAIGVAVGGWLIGRGFEEGRRADRFVTVKGLAEREVQADLALWPLRLVVGDNDLVRAQATLARNTGEIMRFLSRHGIDTVQAELQGIRVVDAFAQPYGGNANAPNRFVITQTVMVRSSDSDAIFAASQHVGQLVEAGVVFSSGEEWGPGGPTFVFTQLNDLKPEMIAEATASAREAAQQFANDSESELGGIRRASQGVFVILPRDQAPGVQEQNQLYKTVRVVSTIEYLLDE